MATIRKLGQRVTYNSTDGFPKAALVLGTHESIKAHGTVTQPDPGNLRLEVHSPTGKVYVKDNVAEGTTPGTWSRD